VEEEKMKSPRTLLIMSGLMVAMLVLMACGPAEATDTGNQGTPESPPPQAVVEVTLKFSQDTGISMDEIMIIDYEEVDWPDACLGISQEDQACAQVITPGYRVVLAANGEEYTFRSDLDGMLIIQE
jgi:hypothetical protein